MAKKRRFYRNIVTVVILSEDKPIGSDTSLADLDYLINDGPCVCEQKDTVSQKVTAQEMANLLTKAGSEPGFFGL